MGADNRPATVQGPTRMEQSDAFAGRWLARPHLARVIRFSLIVFPFAMTVSMGLVVSTFLPPEKLGINRWLWLALLVIAAAMSVRVLHRLARRVLPLATLYKFSLIFPDETPSRFGVALRTGSTRSLRMRIEEIQAGGDALTGHDAYAAQMLELVAMLDEHDRLTRGHCERVRAYTDLIIEELGLHERDANRLRWAALLHDLGKLMVPAEILNKKGDPDKDEWEIVKTHPAEGLRLAQPLAVWLGDWLDAVGQHHERWDGDGYPAGLAATDIHLGARIVAVADAYDVMTSVRSYKAPLPAHMAVAEIADCAGSQFDPLVARAFLDVGLGPLRRTAGPLAWFAGLPVVAKMGLVGMAASTAGATAITLAAIATVFGLGFQNASETSEPPPSVDRMAVSIEEDQEEIFVVSQPGNDIVSVSIATPPSHGTAILEAGESVASPDGITRLPPNVHYTPDPDYFGPDRIDFTACDTYGRCTGGSIDVDIVPVNDPPHVVPVIAIVEEGGTVHFVITGRLAEALQRDSTVLVPAIDPEGAALTLTALGAASHGVLVDNGDGTVSYTHDGSETLTDSFTYTVEDPEGLAASATVTVTVIGVNDPPVANPDTVTVAAGGFVTTVDLRDNDIDPEGAALTLTALGAASHGVLVDNGDGTVSYTHDGSETLTDSFTYTVEDPEGLAASATVTVTVIGVNDPPVANPDTVTVAEVACNDGDTITADVDGNVTNDSGLCNIANGVQVNGDIEVRGFELRLLGPDITVNGNIKVESGKVEVRGSVHGNIEVKRGGSRVTLVAAKVSGNVITESAGVGDIAVAFESGDSTVGGNIELKGSGDANTVGAATVVINGLVTCDGAGSDTNIGAASVGGNIAGCPVGS